eukprot:1281109-Rhodomonas_salina.3
MSGTLMPKPAPLRSYPTRLYFTLLRVSVVLGTPVLCRCIVLCAPYGLSGTELGYAATRRPPTRSFTRATTPSPASSVTLRAVCVTLTVALGSHHGHIVVTLWSCYGHVMVTCGARGQVDGMDCFAVKHATEFARKWCMEGKSHVLCMLLLSQESRAVYAAAVFESRAVYAATVSCYGGLHTESPHAVYAATVPYYGSLCTAYAYWVHDAVLPPRRAPSYWR